MADLSSSLSSDEHWTRRAGRIALIIAILVTLGCILAFLELWIFVADIGPIVDEHINPLAASPSPIDDIPESLETLRHRLQLRTALIAIVALVVMAVLCISIYMIYRRLLPYGGASPLMLLDLSKPTWERRFYAFQTVDKPFDQLVHFYRDYFEGNEVPIEPISDPARLRTLPYTRMQHGLEGLEMATLSYDVQDSYLQLVRRVTLAEGHSVVLVPYEQGSDGTVMFRNVSQPGSGFLAVPVASLEDGSVKASEVFRDRLRGMV